MQHQFSLICNKSADEVFDTCKQVLFPQNYKITEKSDSAFVFEGGGLSNTKQNPLLGATRIAVTVSNNRLDIHSELNGVAFMRKFVILFPPALCVFLGAVFYFTGKGAESVKPTLLALIP